MYTQHHIAGTHKAIVFLFALFGLFSFTFNPGNTPSAPAQIIYDPTLQTPALWYDEARVAAEGVIYKVNGVNTSFSEMMALPASQLDTTYWLPWYNNVELDTQLRFGVP